MMEYRKRSLWNRVWENDSLDSLTEEIYVRDVYGEKGRLPWKAVFYGVVMSMWKGFRQFFTVIDLSDKENNENKRYEQKESILLKEKIENLDIAEEPLIE